MEKIAQQGDQGAPTLWSHSDVVVMREPNTFLHEFENKYSNLFGDLRPVIHRCEVPYTVIESVP